MSRRLFLVDANVIDDHALWEDGGLVGVTGPLAADGDVEDDEKGMVEGPGAGEVGRGPGLVEHAVDVPAYLVRLPLDGKGVKAVGEGALGQGVYPGNAVVAR